MKKVLIIQAEVQQYRVDFFEKLYEALKLENTQLKVAYGLGRNYEQEKAYKCDLSPEVGVKVNNYWFLNQRLLYQPVISEILEADLVIVEQANKHLINYGLLLLSALKLKKVAFWGHGRNRQGHQGSWKEKVKQKLLDGVDWWFAYTEGTQNYLIKNGVEENKITVVQNSVNTQQFKSELDQVSEEDIKETKSRLKLPSTAILGLFCGRLYSDKKLDFLIESARIIKQKVPNFELLIIGEGVEQNLIQQMTQGDVWIHHLGARFGLEKATLFKMSSVFLMPGLVGLAILDAFAAELPLITTDIPIHSPEIEYLDNKINGMITPYNPQAYADAVVDVLTDSTLLKNLQTGAKASGERYTIEAMVNHYKNGILNCLA